MTTLPESKHEPLARAVADRVKFQERYFKSLIGTGCWSWIGYINPNGYGIFRSQGRQHMAHRWAYETYVGPIPEGLVMDHLCRVRNCVNPGHMETVTGAENTRRGLSGRNSTIAAKARTHCPNGHIWNESNTCLRAGERGRRYRQCRVCRRAYQKKTYWRNKNAAGRVGA